MLVVYSSPRRLLGGEGERGMSVWWVVGQQSREEEGGSCNACWRPEPLPPSFCTCCIALLRRSIRVHLCVRETEYCTRISP